MISIHAPRVGSDYLFVQRAGMSIISIHAPRVGSDPRADRSIFYQHLHFNPRSPCGERPHRQPVKVSAHGISIHAPRVGSDWGWKCRSTSSSEFQSTLPVWGATRCKDPHTDKTNYFNPRSPCGERRMATDEYYRAAQISIHAPRVGSDSEKTNILFEFSVFQCIICCFSKNTYTLMIEYRIGSRMKSAFFGANLSKKSVHLLFASKQDRVFRHICTFTAEVIYFALIPVSKVIEPQTVLFHIHYTAKFRLQAAALSCVQQAFKYRALNPLTIVDTLFGDLPQAFASGGVLCIYIIGN